MSYREGYDKVDLVGYKHILIATTAAQIEEISDSNWRLLVRNSRSEVLIWVSRMIMILLLLSDKVNMENILRVLLMSSYKCNEVTNNIFQHDVVDVTGLLRI